MDFRPEGGENPGNLRPSADDASFLHARGVSGMQAGDGNFQANHFITYNLLAEAGGAVSLTDVPGAGTGVRWGRWPSSPGGDASQVVAGDIPKPARWH